MGVGRFAAWRGTVSAILAAMVLGMPGPALADEAEELGARERGGYNPPSATLVVDANTGEVMQSSNPDALRHPASLTKVMTLFILFEEMERGRFTTASRLEVSAHAASRPPSKLGLRTGTTISVEEAILALVTKSANDAASVVAEAISGDEASFAQLMTRRARSIGMARTVFRNASGLPDPEQVTTARDMVTLGRTLQDRFPRQYRYFASRNFDFRGRVMRNHNRLLGNVEGVDGIKTGYTRASGFNLLSSARAGGRHVVAVVLGGRSGAARDAQMRQLIVAHLPDAANRRTAPRIQVAEVQDNDGRTIRTPARSAELPARSAEPPARTAEAPRAPEPQPQPVAARPQPRPGSVDPIQPTTVRTIAVPAAAGQPLVLPSVMAFASTAPAIVPAPRPAAAPEVAEPRSTAPAPNPRPGVLGTLPGRTPSTTSSVEPPSAPAQAQRATPGEAASTERSGWGIQIGAFNNESQARESLTEARRAASAVLRQAAPTTERVQRGQQELVRARFTGFDRDGAEAACKALKQADMVCMPVRLQ
jgi:D-alanyl-D-alanine carboxypeptidase